MSIIAARRLLGLARLGQSSAMSATRSMSDGVKAFKDRESAQEASFFTQEDNKLMAKLLSKVQQQSRLADEGSSKQAAAAERDALKTILGKYKLSDAELDKVLAWKHVHY